MNITFDLGALFVFVEHDSLPLSRGITWPREQNRHYDKNQGEAPESNASRSP